MGSKKNRRNRMRYLVGICAGVACVGLGLAVTHGGWVRDAGVCLNVFGLILVARFAYEAAR